MTPQPAAPDCDSEGVIARNCLGTAFPSCADCVDDSIANLFAIVDSVPCETFDSKVCTAIYDTCGCGSCTSEVEAVVDCLYLDTDCLGLGCPVEPPTPPPVMPPTPPPVMPPTPPMPPPTPVSDPVCFSGDAQVQVLGFGTTNMKDLTVGQKVLTSDGTYSKVYSFGHKHPSSKVTYLQVLSKSMGKNRPLEISREHLIYTQDQVTKKTTIVPASELQVGDLLLGEHGRPSPITSIRMVEREGAYSPLLTGAGNLVVNGVVASTYVTRDWLKDSVPGDLLHAFQHGSILPYRLFCAVVGCADEFYNEKTGFSPYVQFWYSVEQRQLHLHKAARFIFLSFMVLPAVFAVVVGKILVLRPTLMATHLAAALVGCIVWKQQQGHKRLKATHKN